MKLKTVVKRILSYLPTKLPVGMTAFEKFCDEVIELSGQFADRDSMVYAIASMVIHAPSTSGYITKNRLVNQLIKSAANQVASQKFQELKMKQVEAQAKKQQEDTALAKTENVEQRVSEA